MKQAAAKLLCMMIMVLIASCTTNTYYNEDADLLIVQRQLLFPFNDNYNSRFMLPLYRGLRGLT